MRACACVRVCVCVCKEEIVGVFVAPAALLSLCPPSFHPSQVKSPLFI